MGLRGIKMAKRTVPPALFQFEEPDWSCIFSDELEVGEARKLWRVYLDAMREVGTVSHENLPSLQRLIVTQTLHDREAHHVAEHGPVIEPKRKSSRSIARVSPHWTTMVALGKECLALESELGLTPRARGKVSPTRRRANRQVIGGGYLKVVR
jgi:P27 family predicted phage terminase small subunit